MFYTKTINKIKAKFAFYNTKNNEFENDIKELKQKIIQLEKRINSIADYIQGPYTQQINKNFEQINMQINAILDKTINKKLEEEAMKYKYKTTYKASKPKKIK